MCVCVRVWSRQREVSERVDMKREIETDRVNICFGSRVCSDGCLCQHHPNGAEINCKTKSEKREKTAHRGKQDEAYT